MLSNQENIVKTQNREEVKLHKKRQRLILKIHESSPNSFMVCMSKFICGYLGKKKVKYN